MLLAQREFSGKGKRKKGGKSGDQGGDKKEGKKGKSKKGKSEATDDNDKAKPSTAVVRAPPITFLSKESLKLELASSGLRLFHVSGILDVKVDNPEKNGFIKIKIESEVPEMIEGTEDTGMKWKPSQKMEKTLFSTEKILKHNSPKLPFPSGRPLHWTLKSKEESYVPLNIKCQTTDVDAEKTKVILEYAAFTRFVLKKVVISVPIQRGVVPDVSSLTGIWRCRFNPGNSRLEWPMDRIDKSNRTGFMEFSVPQVDRSKFFPVSVRFTAACTYSNLKMCVVPLKGLKAPAEFVHKQELEVDEYQLVD
ncbi:clathrin adaptor complexes medium subunit family protein [Artemisia annua]|uniref:Coatomer subunit delta n=1 Tax=Artemisia annua TaxID=35608 RepID=A0A2U1PIJ1_ARTAN|nr:clathrin adaptor complexes medium subunit family protein [Artemisia annua]